MLRQLVERGFAEISTNGEAIKGVMTSATGRVPLAGGAQRPGPIRPRKVFNVQGPLQKLRRHAPVSF
jgi:hypothetical protein